MRLENKNIVVTAAAQGIGRATAIAFANEGANVIATDINLEKLSEIKSANSKIKTNKLDCTNKSEVEEFCKLVDSIYVASRSPPPFQEGFKIIEIREVLILLIYKI